MSARRERTKVDFAFGVFYAGGAIWGGAGELPSVEGVFMLLVGIVFAAVLVLVAHLWNQDRLQAAPRRKSESSQQGQRRTVASTLLGSIDDADEISAMLHDAREEAGSRSWRLQQLDRISGPRMWSGALWRAWTRPLRSVWHRVMR